MCVVACSHAFRRHRAKLEDVWINCVESPCLLEDVVGVIDVWAILLSELWAWIVEVAGFHDSVKVHKVDFLLCIAV